MKQSLRNWIRKWLGWDEIEFRLGLIKEALYNLTPKPLTWLSPWPKSNRPSPVSALDLEAQFEKWKELHEKQKAILDSPPKFKGRPYSLLNLSDEEAVDKLINRAVKDKSLAEKKDPTFVGKTHGVGNSIERDPELSHSGIRPTFVHPSIARTLE